MSVLIGHRRPKGLRDLKFRVILFINSFNKFNNIQNAFDN